MKSSFAVLALCVLLALAEGSPVEHPHGFARAGNRDNETDNRFEDQVAESPERYEPLNKRREDLIGNPVRNVDNVQSENRELALPYSASAQEIPQ